MEEIKMSIMFMCGKEAVYYHSDASLYEIAFFDSMKKFIFDDVRYEYVESYCNPDMQNFYIFVKPIVKTPAHVSAPQ